MKRGNQRASSFGMTTWRPYTAAFAVEESKSLNPSGLTYLRLSDEPVILLPDTGQL